MNKNETNNTLKSYTIEEVMGAVMRLHNEERKNLLYAYEPKQLYEYCKSDENCANTIELCCQCAQGMFEAVKAFADLLEELHNSSKDIDASRRDKMKQILGLYSELDISEKILVDGALRKQDGTGYFHRKIQAYPE